MIKLLVDTDTAGDDVTSLLFALRDPNVSLEAITVVAGNVHLHEAVRNALVTVEAAERDVPVYAGAEAPLMRDLVTAHYVHGDDGMGNSNFPPPRTRPAEGHAVARLIECAREHDGELEVIAQGPLTNIALAFMQDPGITRRVKRLWIMGGANNSIGNITPAAEFNFYVDPEAAHMVFQAGFEITLLPWDVCLADGVLSREELGPVLEMGTKLSEFYLAVNRQVWAFMKERGIDGISHPDALLAAMVLDHDVIAESEHLYVDVEHRSELTRGYSLVDAERVLDREPNAEVVLRADKKRFKEILETVLAG